ncbi:MAG TPA: FAD-binding oxidoreductase [Planctomycetes bacterium]|nr:FAD-binding oxidoreductase [Fuerstiella sp.]HIK91388.1 FAD-binding oxidoreductase [Planctomycetota bacterium]
MTNSSANDSGQQLLMPASTAEVVELLRAAVGSGSRLSTNRVTAAGTNSAPDSVRRVDLQKMNEVVDYPARDMTVTVQAGMAVSELTKILAEENQQLPIDEFDPLLSVGALVAGDIAGPRQYGYGTLRDYVIGIEAVDGQGRIFHAGGRVVKNVAGYDLCRLMVGSRGSLGILTQLTFKLKPLPEQTTLRSFRFDDAADFESALTKLNVSAANPVLLDFNFASSPPAQQPTDDSDCVQKDISYALHIGVEGAPEACSWQIEQLRNDCAGGEEVTSDGSLDLSVDHHCRNAGYGWQDNEVRIRTFPSKLVAVATELGARGYSTQGHAGNGILFVQDRTGDTDVRTVCRDIVSRHGGTVSEWTVDHPAKNPDPLSAKLRSTFDPRSIFTA